MSSTGIPGQNQEGKLILELFVSGMSPKSMTAIENLKKFCERYLKDNYTLEIKDIYNNPEIAIREQIVFSPSLIKRFPLPQKTLIGNFSDSEKTFQALGLNNQ